MNDAGRVSDSAYVRGLSLTVGFMVLAALVLWRGFGAGYHGGFERWVLAMLVIAGLLVSLGLGTALRRGRRPVALGVVSGAFAGLALMAMGYYGWVFTQMGG